VISAAARDKLATIKRYYETPQAWSNKPMAAKDVEWLVEMVENLDNIIDLMVEQNLLVARRMNDLAERANR
jgi:hypothetical protein